MKTIYILLSRSHTLLSRLIHAVTGDAYTHVSIALDKNLHEIYSFARVHPQTPLPAGLIREDLHTAVFAKNGRAPCALYQLSVSDAQYDAIHARIGAMLTAPEPFHYSILGLLLCKLDLAHERCRHMFCSQFVATLLRDAGAATLPKPASLMRPVDFTQVQGLTQCYEGPLGESGGWWRNDRAPGPAPQGTPLFDFSKWPWQRALPRTDAGSPPHPGTAERGWHFAVHRV